ncbi:MAG: FkbM family methyltransferase [Chlamydiales bacterium]|nr:FkbM family methyltransferase [Chlamydiales bacterium]
MQLLKYSSDLYRALFARRFFYKWNRWLHKCSLKGLGIGNCAERSSGEQAFLKRFISPLNNPVIFDVGANIGKWSLMALEANSSAQVYAFEPHKTAFAQLRRLAQVKSYNVACGALIGQGTLFDRNDLPTSTHASLDRKIIDRLNVAISEQVTEILTLDSVIEKEKIESIDLLKIDVEGHEYEVLLGVKEALSKGLIKAIQFEFNEMNVYRRVFFKDILELLPGFEFYRLLPNGQIPLRRYDSALHEIFCFQNILALRLK